MRLIADRFFRVNTVWYRTHWHLYRRRGASHQWSAPAWNWTSRVNIRTVKQRPAISSQQSATYCPSGQRFLGCHSEECRRWRNDEESRDPSLRSGWHNVGFFAEFIPSTGSGQALSKPKGSEWQCLACRYKLSNWKKARSNEATYKSLHARK